MAAKAADTKAVEKKTEDKTEKKAPTHVDGVYTEYGVELGNGAVIDVEVITDRKRLPASYGKLLSEGNAWGLLMAALTVKTRRYMDWAGAELGDLEEVISPIVTRAQEAQEAAEA